MTKESLHLMSSRLEAATVPGRRLVVSILVVCGFAGALAAPAGASFGVAPGSFVVAATTAQAGGHPDITTSFQLNTTINANNVLVTDGDLRDTVVHLPSGLVGYPSAVPRCAVYLYQVGQCPPSTQIGVAAITYLAFGFQFPQTGLPVYNLVPHPGHAAEFGFSPLAAPVRMVASVRPGDYGIDMSITDASEGVAVEGTSVTLWGIPADPSHDAQRGRFGGLPAGVAPVPFLSNPTRCGSPLAVGLAVRSWQQPVDAASVEASAPLDVITGCDRVPFGARVSAAPTSMTAGEPAGYVVDVTVPQNMDPLGLSTSSLSRAQVTLPEGVALSPAVAGGLQACTDDQLAPSSSDAPTCPDASQIGTATLDTPALDAPMDGTIYLGQPQVGNRYRIFLVLQGSGVTVKLQGSVKPDPSTGQLTTTFNDNPDLPFSNLHLEFRGGSRAPLVNPTTCGTKTTTATLTPWSGAPDVTSTSNFALDGCAAPRFSPTLTAGAVNPVAGASSPFTFRVTRDDVDSQLSTISTTLPKGLLANVKGVTLCSAADAANGTCPDSSLVGHVTVGSGAGPAPFYLTDGRAYFTEGYRGAPFGLSMLVPVIAGPFDLGDVNVRAAVTIDPSTAQVSVSTDPLPTMLAGIPLQLRDVRLDMDRPGFMLNPTSCDPQTLGATVTPTAGAPAALTNRFQVGDCASLPLAPKLTMALSKGTKKGAHPTLKAHLTQQAGEAHLRKVVVKLPSALVFDVKNDKGICTTAQAAAHQCPAASRIGTASVVSVLHQPLSGPVYLTQSQTAGSPLPGLFLPLTGEGVTLDLHASTTFVNHSQLVTTFDGIPDAPIVSFDLTIDGGRGGILVLGKSLCSGAKPGASAQMAGQNGKVAGGRVPVATGCKRRRHK